MSQPISTAQGYYLIKLLGKETRPLEPDALTTLKTAAMDSWLTEQRQGLVDMLDSRRLAWVLREAG